MSKWSDFYKDRMNSNYENYLRNRYAPFIQEIVSHPYGSIAEYGCGPGFFTKILQEDYSKPNISYRVCDNDSDILELTKGNVSLLDTQIELKDITQPSVRLPAFDLIFSHGVLEHFSNQKIQIAIALQQMSAPVLIHYVPSAKYNTPSFGDERLMTPRQWKSICSPTDIIEFNDGFDLILIWK